MKINNYCRLTDKYCSEFITVEGINGCFEDLKRRGVYEDHVECKKSNGNPVTKRKITLKCCKDKCKIDARDYATWDGSCILKKR